MDRCSLDSEVRQGGREVGKRQSRVERNHHWHCTLHHILRVARMIVTCRSIKTSRSQ